MSEVDWFQLSGAGFIQVRGADARDYLHRMTTAAVKPMGEGDVRRNLLLRGDGRLVGDFYLVCTGTDEFLMLTPAAAREGLLSQMDMFLFTEKVEITDLSATHHAVCLKGPGSNGALERLFPESSPTKQLLAGSNLWGFLCPDAPLSRPRAIAWSPLDQIGILLAELENSYGPELDSETMTRLRVEDGEPLFGTDMDSTTIPLEAGLGHAIDFTKGCFPGQEVVARIENLGHPANALVGIRGSALGVGDVLFSGEKKIGRVTTAAPADVSEAETVIALGYVKWDFRSPGTVVEAETANGRAKVEVVALPMSSAADSSA